MNYLTALICAAMLLSGCGNPYLNGSPYMTRDQVVAGIMDCRAAGLSAMVMTAYGKPTGVICVEAWQTAQWTKGAGL